MAGRCRECRYWMDGKCDVIAMGEAGDELKYGAYIDADAADDWGLHAALVTSPDFGCTSFQAK